MLRPLSFLAAVFYKECKVMVCFLKLTKLANTCLLFFLARCRAGLVELGVSVNSKVLLQVPMLGKVLPWCGSGLHKSSYDGVEVDPASK